MLPTREGDQLIKKGLTTGLILSDLKGLTLILNPAADQSTPIYFSSDLFKSSRNKGHFLEQLPSNLQFSVCKLCDILAQRLRFVKVQVGGFTPDFCWLFFFILPILHWIGRSNPHVCLQAKKALRSWKRIWWICSCELWRRLAGGTKKGGTWKILPLSLQE